MEATSHPASCQPICVLGRYALYGEIAAGGMASVHFGRLTGPVGFSRTVAIKRLHPHFAKDPEFVAMFLDEARLAARVSHPNVTATLDVVATEGELFLVMEYVQGESLARLLHAVSLTEEPIPLPIVSSIMTGALQGLHAAHEATNEQGEPLGIVHRDVSPQNVMVGADGVARVLDFGIAKAAGRSRTTQGGEVRGKAAYMAPEQIQGTVTRATDVYAAGVVLWEALSGKRMFEAENHAAMITAVLAGPQDPPSKYNPAVPATLDALVMKAMQADPGQRFATTREMAREVEKTVTPASTLEVGEWVERIAGERLARRSQKIAEIESASFTPPAESLSHALAARTDKTGSDSLPTRKLSQDLATGTTSRRAILPVLMAGLVILVATGWFLVRPREPATSTAAVPSVGPPPLVSALPSNPAPPPAASVWSSAPSSSASGTAPAARTPAPPRVAPAGANPKPTEDFDHVIDSRH
jgi:eukaryotic-like serine/threonine-protein kinase